MISDENKLYQYEFETKLGSMVTIGDHETIYLLEFKERKNLNKQIDRIKLSKKSEIIPGSSEAIIFMQEEVKKYLEGNLRDFKTKITILGTEFQKTVWNKLKEIPYGQTRSYLEQAKNIESPSSFRAVANANGMNQLAIIIPCHRVINSNGNLGGYAGGIEIKRWLLAHEKANLMEYN